MTNEAPDSATAAAETISYVRLYTDADNVTRWEDLDFATAPMDFAPPAPSVFVTSPSAANAVLFLRFPKGWVDAAHPTPARQFAFLLAGDVIGTVGEEERRFGPGSIFLMEDTHGPGHGSPS